MSKNKILYKKSVSKDFEKIDHQYRRKVKKKIEKKLTHNIYDGEKLKGKFSGLWKLRLGNYRATYIIKNSDTAVIVKVGTREGYYKK
ncbi:MAG: type II toxin-antitoxin system RelE family toxin [Elusimicrobiota bacterium]